MLRALAARQSLRVLVCKTAKYNGNRPFMTDAGLLSWTSVKSLCKSDLCKHGSSQRSESLHSPEKQPNQRRNSSKVPTYVLLGGKRRNIALFRYFDFLQEQINHTKQLDTKAPVALPRGSTRLPRMMLRSEMQPRLG